MSKELFSLGPTNLQIFKAGEAGPKEVKRIIYGQARSNANGVATLYFTDNGLASGKALLQTIDFASASAYSTDAQINKRPSVKMREKNMGAKYVSANVTKYNVVNLLNIDVLGSEVPMANVLVDFFILGTYAT